MLKLKIIIASTRPGRLGLPIGEWFAQVARQSESFEVAVLDLADINLPLLNEPHHPRLAQYTQEHTRAWSRLIEDGDAFVLVTPEYNYGFPASLKNALDYLHREWQYKPVSFVSYGGIAGGTRAVQLLKPVLTALSLVPLAQAVVIPHVSHYLDDTGQFLVDDPLVTQAQTVLTALVPWAKHLRALRQELSLL